MVWLQLKSLGLQSRRLFFSIVIYTKMMRPLSFSKAVILPFPFPIWLPHSRSIWRWQKGSIFHSVLLVSKKDKQIDINFANHVCCEHKENISIHFVHAQNTWLYGISMPAWPRFQSNGSRIYLCTVIVHPRLLVRATSERFLPAKLV